MAGSTLSRRLSEFVGVALFALALHLAHRARQLQRVGSGVVLQHRDRICRRRISPGGSARSWPSCRTRCSGYSAYLIPVVLVVLGWHYFWCRDSGRRLHEARRRRAALRAACRPSCRSRSARSDVSGKTFRAGGYMGDWLAGGSGGVPQPHGLDHPDPDAALPRHHPVDAVLVRPAVFGAIAQLVRDRWRAMLGRMRERREETAPRQAAPGSAEEASRQGAEGSQAEDSQARRMPARARSEPRAAAEGRAATIRPCRRGRAEEAVADRGDGRRGRGRAESRLVAADAAAATIRRPPAPPVEASLPLSGTGEGSRRAQEGHVRHCRRWRCSTRPGESGRSTSASSWTARGCSRRNAASSRSKGSVVQIHPGPSSRPTSSSRTPA